MISKLLPTLLVTATLLLNQAQNPPSAIAKTCAGASCRPRPIQFIPGQRINVEVVNMTSSLVQMEKVEYTDAIPLNPGQVLRFVKGGSTEPNFSLVFWAVSAGLLQVNIVKSEPRTLRIELRPGGRIPGDRSVYLKDDGRVNVF